MKNKYPMRVSNSLWDDFSIVYKFSSRMERRLDVIVLEKRAIASLIEGATNAPIIDRIKLRVKTTIDSELTMSSCGFLS
jgi:hypothetical protein